MVSLYKDPNGERVFDEAMAIDSGRGAKVASGRGTNSLGGSHPALNKTSSLERKVSVDVIQYQPQNGVSL